MYTTCMSIDFYFYFTYYMTDILLQNCSAARIIITLYIYIYIYIYIYSIAYSHIKAPPGRIYAI